MSFSSYFQALLKKHEALMSDLSAYGSSIQALKEQAQACRVRGKDLDPIWVSPPGTRAFGKALEPILREFLSSRVCALGFCVCGTSVAPVVCGFFR